MISISGITKSFPDGKGQRAVLKDVHMDIEKGTLTALMGRSGCGKTTLLYILAGLIKPDAGNYRFEGQALPLADRRAMRQFRLKNIGFILQEDTLLYDRNVENNILLGAHFLGQKRGDAHSEARFLSEQLNVASLLDASPAVLSGGEKQRVAIARSLIGGKKLLLADEPTGALDHDNAVNVLECFAHLREQGKTILLVTHDEAVAAMCDRIIHLEYGRITGEEKGGA